MIWLWILHDIIFVTEANRCFLLSEMKKTRWRQFLVSIWLLRDVIRDSHSFQLLACPSSQGSCLHLASGGYQVATASVPSCIRQEGKDWAVSICPFTSGEANLLQRLPVDFGSHPISPNCITLPSWTSKEAGQVSLSLGTRHLENSQSFVNQKGGKNAYQLGSEEGMPQQFIKDLLWKESEC